MYLLIITIVILIIVIVMLRVKKKINKLNKRQGVKLNLLKRRESRFLPIRMQLQNRKR